MTVAESQSRRENTDRPSEANSLAEQASPDGPVESLSSSPAEPFAEALPARADTRRGRRWGRGIVVFLALLLAGVYFLPPIIARTPLRDEVFRLFLLNYPGPVHVKTASLDWFSPVHFGAGQLTTDRGSLKVDIPNYDASHPLWRYAFRGDDLGEIHITKPSAHVVVRKARDELVKTEETRRAKRRKRPTNVDVWIDRAEVSLRRPDVNEPWTNVENITLKAHLEPTAQLEQRVVIEPGSPLQNVSLSPAMCETGLRFILPVIADATWSKGEFSLAIDRCDLVLERPTEGELAGRLSIHEMHVGARNPILLEVGRIIETIAPNRLPTSIRFLRDSVVRFEMVEQGIRHRDLAFGLPDFDESLVIRTEGWIGFDERLDMIVELPIPIRLPPSHPLYESVRREKLRVPLRGTLRQPKIDFAAARSSGVEMARHLLDSLRGSEGGGPVVESARRLTELLSRPSPEGNAGRQPPDWERMVEKGLPEVGKVARKIIEKNRNRLDKPDDGGRPRPLKKLLRQILAPEPPSPRNEAPRPEGAPPKPSPSNT